MELLVNKAKTGDKNALTQLYSYFHGKIYRYVFLKCGNYSDAEDITEEVFLRMVESINRFHWKGIAFSAWLFRIARNLVVDHYRYKARRNTQDIKDHDYIDGNNWEKISEFLDNRDLIKAIYEHFASLTDLQKEVVNLRFAGGLSLKETAEALSKNVNSVKAIQHAAIKKLKGKIKEVNIQNIAKKPVYPLI